MKILITGGMGYLGSRIAEFLVATGKDVYILDRNTVNKQPGWMASVGKVFLGDIRDDKILQLLSEFQFDVIIHTISLDHNDCAKKDFDLVCSINVGPTWNLLKFFSERGLKKFIYFSTQQVYGRIKNDVISEETIPNPVNVYGLTHLMSEHICDYYSNNSKTKCINIRLSNSYGSPVYNENNCWWLVINDFCKSAYLNKQITILSDGTPQRDFINIKDLCRCLEILVDISPDKIKHNLFNIGSGTTLTILELSLIVAKVYKMRFKNDLPISFTDGTPVTSISSKEIQNRFTYNVERIKNIGFENRVGIEEGIGEIFEYLEKSC